MNKQELISELSETTGVSKKDVASVLNTLPLLLSATLASEGRVVIPGIGIAKIKDRPARTARNLHTGEAIEVPAKQVVSIKASKGFPVTE